LLASLATAKITCASGDVPEPSPQGQSPLVAFRNSLVEVRMQRFIVWSIGAFFGALCTLLSAVSLEAAEPTAEEAIRKALDEKTEFAFVEMPLSDVVAFIAKRHKIQIVLDQKSLDDAGVGSDIPISRKLTNISLRSALRLTLRELDLTWVIDDEVLQITTVDEASNRLRPRVYDVTDLVVVDGQADYDTLIETLTTIIAPTTWDEVGGPGSIAPFPLVAPAHALVVSQTAEIQERIAEFLADVRGLRAAHQEKARKLAAHEAPAPQADPNAISLKIYKVAVPQRSQAAGAEGSLAAGQAVVGARGGMGSYVPDERYLEQLAQAVPGLIQPETWEKAGGHGVIHALPADATGTGQLLVRQTGYVHAQLQKFLSDLQTKGGAGGFGGGGFY
jgi:hypothetical protein